MPSIEDIIDDYQPANNEVGTPLKSKIIILFDRVMDEVALSENIFLEGPDTDQFVGPDLQFQDYPFNVSQGDDFLTSPGLKGITTGKVTFERISLTDPPVVISGNVYRTRYIFTPDHALAALTDYTVHIPDFVDSGNVTYSGYLTFDFTTGTGSIKELPSSVSSSIINTALIQTLSVGTSTGAFRVISTNPADHSVQISPELDTITITFNNNIDPSSVDPDDIKIVTTPATGHPAACAVSIGDIAKSITVDGNKLIIRI